MKKTIISIILIAGFIASYHAAEASFQCGVPPIPQPGCEISHCQCDDSGCSWVQICK